MNLEQLKSYEPRQFVDQKADLSDKDTVVTYYQTLLDHEIHSKEDLENWLINRSELETVMDQHGSVLYILMTCQTDDQKRADDYKQFIENVIPAVKPLAHKLDLKYLEERKRHALDTQEYAIYDRSVQSQVDLFIDKNVPLQTEEQLLSQEYQTICGSMTVQFEGEEKTLPQMSKYLLMPDRGLREKAWRATTGRRMQDRQKLDDLFDKMLNIRNEIAENANCDNFCEYQFKAFERFDYTPTDCRKYHDVILSEVVPVWKTILKRRQESMGLDAVRPWDTSVDPKGRDPLKPFEKIDKLISGVGNIIQKIDSEFTSNYKDMADLGLLNLESRKGKAPGGYHTSLAEARKPFIFMNAVGVDNDVYTLLHESGHAFHSMAAKDKKLHDYRHAPMEFCEVASMGMELLGKEYIDSFYDEKESARSRVEHFEDIVFTLVWVAIVDAFQMWIYENKGHSQKQRADAWIEIHNQFGGNEIDWSGLDEEHKFMWHRQLHIFEVPFYYIEYGIAQLGALQLWQNSKKNFESAVQQYKKGLALGGSRPLPEIFQTAGLKFDFLKETVAPLMEAVKKEI